MKTIAQKRAEQGLQEDFANLVRLAASTEGTPESRRDEALHLIDSVKVAYNMLANTKPSPVVGDYSGCDAREAVFKYLDLRGTPATEDEIIDAIFAGGFKGGDRDNHRLSVDLSIRNHLTGTGRNHKKFGLRGDIRGLIGLKNWEENAAG